MAGSTDQGFQGTEKLFDEIKGHIKEQTKDLLSQKDGSDITKALDDLKKASIEATTTLKGSQENQEEALKEALQKFSDIERRLQISGIGNTTQKSVNLDRINKYATSIHESLKTAKSLSMIKRLNPLELISTKTVNVEDSNVTGLDDGRNAVRAINDPANLYDPIARIDAITNSISTLVPTPMNGSLNDTVEVTGGGNVEAAFRFPGALISKLEREYTLKDNKLQPIADFIKVTIETMQDIPQVRQWLINSLITSVINAAFPAIIEGSGTPPDPTGLATFATAWAQQGGVIVPTANNFDVLNNAVAQILNNDYSPNFMLVNPSDAFAMVSTKNVDGLYINPVNYTIDLQGGAARPWMIYNGIPIYANRGITADTFLVGDTMASRTAFDDNFIIDFTDSNEDDFIKGIIAVRAMSKVAVSVGDNRAKGLITGGFAASRADLLS